MRSFRVGLCEYPAFEDEVWSCAAHDTPVGLVFEHESGVRTRQVVRLQLVEGGFYVRVPFLLVKAVAVEVERHHELAKVRGLLDLEDKGVWPEGVKDSAWNVDGVAGPDFVLRHDGFVVLGPERT